MTDAIREIFNRIPALRELRGAARLDAEEVLQNALDDAVEDGRADALLDRHDAEIAAEAAP
jgi:hypothetical protein